MVGSARTGPKRRRRRAGRPLGRVAASPGSAVAITLVALALAVGIGRLTAASELADSRPGLAESLAPRAPDVLLSTAMAGVGRSAAQGQLPNQASRARLRELSKAAPLNTQALLVEAAIAQRSGDAKRARLLLVEARRLQPRSAAARYLLAELLMREGQVAEGLGELAVLARLLRQDSIQLVPALADLARSNRAASELNQVLQTNPRLRGPLLNALASDPDNESLLLQLADPAARPVPGNIPQWQGTLLRAMIAQGSYERSYALWRRLSGVRGPRPLLFNGEFRSLPAGPPFNWTFASSGAGFAEPGNGSLRILFYGRDNVILATQLLLLPQGRYRLVAPVSGTPAPGALVWAVVCEKGRPIGQQDLAARRPLQFEVPASCPAQKLELRGWLQDMPKESDIRIGASRIERIGS